MSEIEKPKLNIAMFPWLDMARITPFVLLANELAIRGHSISFFITEKAMFQIIDDNIYRDDLIQYYLISVPQADGLPEGAEMVTDVDDTAVDSLVVAFDSMYNYMGTLLSGLQLDLVFYDYADWVPKLAVEFGFKTVCYNVVGVRKFDDRVTAAMRKCDAIGIRTCRELEGPMCGFPEWASLASSRKRL